MSLKQMSTFLSSRVTKTPRQESLKTRRQRIGSWEDIRQLYAVSNYVVQTFNRGIQVDVVLLDSDPHVSREAKEHALQVLKEHGAEY